MERPLGPGVRKKGRNTYQVSVENYKKDKEKLGPEKFEKLKKESQKQKFLTGGQAKIAAKAPPPNKIDEKDFAVLRAEKAKGRGMGLQDESVKPGKVQKAVLGLMFMKQAKKKGAKGAEFLSPLAMLKRISGKKRGGGIKIKKDPTKTVNPFEKKSSKFMERRKKLAAVKSLAGKAGRLGAIGAAVLTAGAGAAKLGQTIGRKMSEKKDKKMGGGMMMQRPMGYKSGGPPGGSGSSYTKGYEGRRKTGKGVRESLKDKVTPMKKERLLAGLEASGKMGGGMIAPSQRPGYSKGTMIMARGCKLGRKKPTKIT